MKTKLLVRAYAPGERFEAFAASMEEAFELTRVMVEYSGAKAVEVVEVPRSYVVLYRYEY